MCIRYQGELSADQFLTVEIESFLKVALQNVFSLHSPHTIVVEICTIMSISLHMNQQLKIKIHYLYNFTNE